MEAEVTNILVVVDDASDIEKIKSLTSAIEKNGARVEVVIRTEKDVVAWLRNADSLGEPCSAVLIYEADPQYNAQRICGAYPKLPIIAIHKHHTGKSAHLAGETTHIDTGYIRVVGAEKLAKQIVGNANAFKAAHLGGCGAVANNDDLGRGFLLHHNISDTRLSYGPPFYKTSRRARVPL